MNCEFEFCIYSDALKCRLETITINSLGMCDDCIVISLDKGFLEAEKVSQREKINSRRENPGD